MREDLILQYESEIGILNQFVLEKEDKRDGGTTMSEAELDSLVQEVRGELGVRLVGGKIVGKDLGRMVKTLVERTKGKAEGKEVADAVKRVGA